MQFVDKQLEIVIHLIHVLTVPEVSERREAHSGCPLQLREAALVHPHEVPGTGTEHLERYDTSLLI